MTDSPTDTWLSRLRALEPTERAALLTDMARGELEMVLLRVLAENDRLREALKWFEGTRELLAKSDRKERP